MLHGFHVAIGAYGFWLPNDPRGSWSEFVGKWELVQFGRATKVTTARSLANEPHDRQLRLAAKRALQHPPVKFTGEQALSVAKGFAWAARESGYTIHACAVLPEHAHLVIGRHERNIRLIVSHLKGRATQQLKRDGRWPIPDCPVWGQRPWAVYLDSVDDMHRAITYVDDNPRRSGLKRQKWSFVTRYEAPSDI